MTMKKEMVTRRVVETAALFLIGDGIMGLIKPRWHSLLWSFGPQLMKAATEELAEHRNAARFVYAVETAVGITLASLQTPTEYD